MKASTSASSTKNLACQLKEIPPGIGLPARSMPLATTAWSRRSSACGNSGTARTPRFGFQRKSELHCPATGRTTAGLVVQIFGRSRLRTRCHPDARPR